MFVSKHGRLRLLGADPAVDFANSSDRVRGVQIDFLADYEDLIGWSAAAGLLRAEEVRDLAATAARTPGRAADVLADALRLRQALRLELGVRTGHAERRFDELPGLLERVMGKVRFERRGENLVSTAVDALELPLVRISLAIVELLTSPRADRVRICEGPDCGWFFVDETRASPRRWCSMRSCGNRAKVARHRHRIGQPAA